MKGDKIINIPEGIEKIIAYGVLGAYLGFIAELPFDNPILCSIISAYGGLAIGIIKNTYDLMIDYFTDSKNEYFRNSYKGYQN